MTSDAESVRHYAAAFAKSKGYDLHAAMHKTAYRPGGSKRHTVTITFDEVG